MIDYIKKYWLLYVVWGLVIALGVISFLKYKAVKTVRPVDSLTTVIQDTRKKTDELDPNTFVKAYREKEDKIEAGKKQLETKLLPLLKAPYEDTQSMTPDKYRKTVEALPEVLQTPYLGNKVLDMVEGGEIDYVLEEVHQLSATYGDVDMETLRLPVLVRVSYQAVFDYILTIQFDYDLETGQVEDVGYNLTSPKVEETKELPEGWEYSETPRLTPEERQERLERQGPVDRGDSGD